jgi:hypothetical protein
MAAMFARMKPRKKGCASTTYMQVAGRTRGKTGTNCHRKSHPIYKVKESLLFLLLMLKHLIEHFNKALELSSTRNFLSGKKLI